MSGRQHSTRATFLGWRCLLMCAAFGRPHCCAPPLLRAQVHTVHTQCSRPETHGLATTSCAPMYHAAVPFRVRQICAAPNLAPAWTAVRWKGCSPVWSAMRSR